ncbi:E3 ubiquitin-protein ligase APD2 isoform X2 [Cryptomeria japonica]|uniref:E3 ubiquitin-protein ligase APD2 isoform X2 n=1 Tax=Cryptomeria japonica TaxID=3369 RepID=UPI0025AD23C2|nr:E3 ubiquitin-protein ligase APD2 isoform X2 [Cryptomeria japonica]
MGAKKAGGSGGGSAFSSAGSGGAFSSGRSAFSTEGSSTLISSSASRRRNNSGWRRRDYYSRENRAPVLEPHEPTSRDFWIAVVVVLPLFAIFGSFWLMFDAYGSKKMEVGLNSSYLLKANEQLVESILVRNIDQVPGLRLYLFENKPLLNKTKEWTAEHNVMVSGNHHKEWAFWLNQRSEVNMVYKLPSTSSLFIIVAKGTAQFSNWVSDPSNPDSCSLWRPIKFCMEIKSKTYETETANSWCPLDVKSCKILPSLRGSKVGLLTTPDKPQDGVDFWKVEVSYRTRWQTYLIFDGTLLFAVLFILYFICKPKGLSNLSPEETPLNSQQDAHTRSQEANIDSNSVQHFANEGEPRSWIDERTQFMETW